MNLSISTPIKILADGTFLKVGSPRTDHVALLLPEQALMVHPVSLGNAEGEYLPDHAACVARCRELRVLGFDDWELARREDWNHILDLARHNPAVDTSLYPGIKPRWHWTATDCAWGTKNAAGVSPSAWGVFAYYGFVGNGRRSYSGFALAVRRVGQ